MNNGSGVSRGDRNRNARLQDAGAGAGENAIVGIDLAERKQMVVVTTIPRCWRARSGARPGISVPHWTGLVSESPGWVCRGHDGV